jgi:hypothetical protein
LRAFNARVAATQLSPRDLPGDVLVDLGLRNVDLRQVEPVGGEVQLFLEPGDRRLRLGKLRDRLLA